MKNRSRTGPFGGDPKEDIDAISKEGINAHFYVSPNTATNGKAGDAVCMNLLNYYLKIKQKLK